MGLKQSNELQVLLNLLRGELPSHLKEVDVYQLFRLFQRHRLLPLASDIIELLDEPNRVKWKHTIQTLNLRSLHLSAELGKIITGFNKAGIKAIPLKGPVLAQSLFGNLGSRHSVDLDILIKGVEITRILEVAEGLGFVQTFPKSGLSSKQWDHYFRYKKEMGLTNANQSVFVELHQGIDNLNILNPSEKYLLFEDLSKQKIGGSEFYCMNFESSFLYLAFHGGLHQYRRLFWLRDITTALERWKLDHFKILADAKKLGMERLLGVSLLLASHYFNTEIPAVYQPYIKENKKILQRLRNFCMEQILGPENFSFSKRIARLLYILSLKPGIFYKCSVIRGIFHRWYLAKFLGGN